MFYSNKYFYRELEELAMLNIPFEEMNNKNILVTGANGLIASYLIDFLMYLIENRKINLKVYALCRNEEKAEKRFSSHKNKKYFNLIIQDVCDDYNYKIKFDYIIHAASNAHPKAFIENPIGVIEANIIGTKKLLDYSIKNGNEKFLYISSSEVYGFLWSYGIAQFIFNCKTMISVIWGSAYIKLDFDGAYENFESFNHEGYLYTRGKYIESVIDNVCKTEAFRHEVCRQPV